MILGLHHVSLKCGTSEAYARAKDFYLRVLGLRLCREWPEGVMIDTGSGLIEIFNNGEGSREKGAVRHFALLTDDVDGIARRVTEAGYPCFIEPKDAVLASEPPYPIRIAFCNGPLGEEIEFFAERGAAPRPALRANEYQRAAMTTLNPALENQDVLINGVMGLCGEAGEAIDLVKKHLAQRHALDTQRLAEELGDVAWYLAETATAIGCDLEDILRANLAKLQKRYPEGFSAERSIMRDQPADESKH